MAGLLVVERDLLHQVHAQNNHRERRRKPAAEPYRRSPLLDELRPDSTPQGTDRRERHEQPRISLEPRHATGRVGNCPRSRREEKHDESDCREAKNTGPRRRHPEEKRGREDEDQDRSGARESFSEHRRRESRLETTDHHDGAEYRLSDQ